MNIQVIPARCVKASEELRQTQKRLTYQAAGIEETAKGLRRSDEESMQVVAGKLNRIAENLKIKAKLIYMMSAALDRIAALYGRTEDGICDHEDMTAAPAPVYRAVELVAGRENINENFNKL